MTEARKDFAIVIISIKYSKDFMIKLYHEQTLFGRKLHNHVVEVLVQSPLRGPESCLSTIKCISCHISIFTSYLCYYIVALSTVVLLLYLGYHFVTSNPTIVPLWTKGKPRKFLFANSYQHALVSSRIQPFVIIKTKSWLYKKFAIFDAKYGCAYVLWVALMLNMTIMNGVDNELGLQLGSWKML